MIRAPGGSLRAPAGWLGGHFSCSFIVFQRFPCVLRLGSWIRSLVAQILGEDEHLEGDMGTRKAPYRHRVALARHRRRGSEGTYPAEL